MPAGELHHRAIRELTQLYLNIGEHDRAKEMIATAPNIYGSRAFLKINGTDGKERAKAYGEALLEVVRACSEIMVQCVIAYKNNISIEDKIQSLRGSIEIFYTVCTDGNCGRNHSYIARIYTLLSLYLWLDGKKDDAFESLYKALEQFKLFEDYCVKDAGHYTAPLVRLVQYESIQAKANDDFHPHTSRASLAEDWPWWCVPEYAIVKPEIQEDPRWNEWVSKLQ